MDTLGQIIQQIQLYSGNSANDTSDSFWRKLLIENFITELSDSKQDDLLFFIYKLNRHDKLKSCSDPVPRIDVLRKCSPNLPLTSSCAINWEETLFLNIILQKLEYSVLYSICTRTSRKHYQVLSKQKLNVFATPSSHSVLFKESLEQYSYPYINFYIENFEEFLYENIINELESIYIELIAKDLSSEGEPFVLFSACINYKSVNDSYCKENRIICNGQYLCVLHIKDCSTDGKAEIVVKKKIKRSVSDGSTFSMVMDFEEKPDSSLDLYLLNVNRKTKTKLANMYLTYPLRRATKCLTIESDEAFTDLDDELLSSMWTKEGFTQSYFEWKERQKHGSNSFHCFTTNISLPWNHIINNLISSKKRASLFLQ